jgi:hypothetical protein
MVMVGLLSGAPVIAGTEQVRVMTDEQWCKILLPGQRLAAAREQCADSLAGIGVLATRGDDFPLPESVIDALTAVAPAAPTPAPVARAPIPGSGTFLVGTDVAPGTYRSAGPAEGWLFCYHARLSGLSGELDDIISNDNSEGPTLVTISSTDAAFETNGCQDWTPA